MTKPVFSWLSWVPLILLLNLVNTYFASTKCLEDQRSLLLQVSRNLEFNRSKSTKLVTWGPTSDCCQWRGVQCNDTTGHVIGIDLSGESINGSFDNLSSLFSLRFLQSLNLANNSFQNATISSEIGKLSALIHLNLSNADFSGQVPQEISQLTKLETLDLSSLPYSGFLPLNLENRSFTMVIKNLTNIRELYLDGVMISANGLEWCKAVSSSLPNLQVLSLSNCNLSGEIDLSLSKLHSLSVIRLDQNNLMAVPDFIAKFRNLTLLKLSDCQLKGTFPQKILQLPTLRSLDLSYNPLLQGTLPKFPKNGSLQTLVLSFTKFSGLIPNSIGYLKQLHRIELSNCNFHGSIPPSMTSFHQLEYLDFSYNNISGPIPSFSSANNVTQLKLGHNALTGSLHSTDWERLVKLLNLDFSSNSLHGNIPGSLFRMPSLLSIQLSQNRLVGQISKFNLSSPLQTLDLSSNRLEGTIPKSLFRLQGLNILNLSFNRFNGTVTLNDIQQLKNLSVLELSYNSLSVYAGSTGANLSFFPQLGTIGLGSCNLSVLPTFLKNQSRLLRLDLSDNQIQGSIPRWIWTLGNGSLSFLNLSCNYFTEVEPHLQETPSLKVVDLHSNKLPGVLPKLPPNAFYLDYSNNHFNSTIPSNVGDLFNFTILFSLSSNNISGNIPTSLCSHIYLQVLDLSYNQLHGTIPSCLINMTSTLGVLNLRGNSLTGIVPDIFPGRCMLRTLNVNTNHLEGSVPKSLASCKGLEVLDLGKNQFRDFFPLSLRNLLHLHVLVLRFNKFRGPIPCLSNHDSWQKLQIVDIASNEFDGELQEQCFLKWTAMMVEGGDSVQNTSVLQYPVYDIDHYEDVVSVTFKGSEFKFTKILTILTCIDFSDNQFHGVIPGVIGNLDALRILNLSHNGFSGSIPSSLGNLSMLESLDLSYNQLNESIPTQFIQLNFLEVLNLSSNKLVGEIPQGHQFSTFDQSSYEDNPGLCGEPLPKRCSTSHGSEHSTTVSKREKKSTPAAGLDWQFILPGTGFGTGLGLVIAPFIFWRKGRKWYDEQVNKLASTILFMFVFDYTSLSEARPGQEERFEHQLFEISDEDEDEEDTTEDDQDYVRFCVFCSKLDIEKRRVIHNPSCTCHGSPYISLLHHLLES